eukprot:5539255-Amphidinium_carterae.1
MRSENAKKWNNQNRHIGDEMHNELCKTRWTMPTEENKLETEDHDEMNEYEKDSKDQRNIYERCTRHYMRP